MKTNRPALVRLLCLFACLTFNAAAADKDKKTSAPAEPVEVVSTGQWTHQELKRFPAKEANQGVVADDKFLYVITNTAIGKYDKTTFERVGGWEEEKGGPFIHMNAGIIHEGKLLCAHSNFPGVPMTSSIEIFDPQKMTHVGTRSFGIDSGSLTWIAPHEGGWLACFAHYSKSQPQTGRGPSSTELVRFDAEWRRTGGWVFPQGIIDIFGGSSCSGGSISAGGDIFITGHDAKQLCVLRFPEAGSILQWTDTIPMTAEGQSFSWDPVQPGIFYGIVKKTKEVVVSRIEKAK